MRKILFCDDLWVNRICQKACNAFYVFGFGKKWDPSQSLSSWWLVPQPLLKDMRTVVKLDHETPRVGMKIPKNMWVATTYSDFLVARSSPHKFWVVFFHLPHLRFRSLLFVVAPVTGHGTLERASGQPWALERCCVGPGLFPNDPPAGTIWKGTIPTYTSEHWHEFIYLSTDFAVIELHHFIEIWDIYLFSKIPGSQSVCLPIRFIMLPCAYLFYWCIDHPYYTHTSSTFLLPVPTRPPKHKTLS